MTIEGRADTERYVAEWIEQWICSPEVLDSILTKSIGHWGMFVNVWTILIE